MGELPNDSKQAILNKTTHSLGGKKVYFLVELKCGQQKIWTTSKIKDKKAFSSRSSSCMLLRDA